MASVTRSFKPAITANMPNHKQIAVVTNRQTIDELFKAMKFGVRTQARPETDAPNPRTLHQRDLVDRCPLSRSVERDRAVHRGARGAGRGRDARHS